MLFYLLLALLVFLIGCGVLYVARVELPQTLNYLLAPVVGLAFWTIFLAWGIQLGYPVSQLAPIGWGISAVFAIIGFFQLRLSQLKQQALLFLVVLLLPVVLMAPYFWFGITHFFGSPQPDAWHYVAIGKYLWNYPIGTEGNLTPLNQIAALASQSRFISSALLGFFSFLIGSAGNIVATANLLNAWSLFIFSSACAFFIAACWTGVWRYIYLVFTIISLLVFCPLLINNFDNLLILALFPALAGFIQLIQYQRYSWTLIQVLFLVALIFAYIEMMPFVIAGISILWLEKIYRDDAKNIKRYAIFAVIIGLLTAAIISPFIHQLITYFLSQFSSSQQSIGQRSGEGQHLTQFALHPVSFLLHYVGWTRLLIAAVFAAIVGFLILLGCCKLWQTKQRGIVIVALLFLIMSFYMLFGRYYLYGSYKIILISEWMLSFILITGIATIFNQFYKINKASVVIFSSLGLLWLSANLFAAWYLLHKVQTHFIPRAACDNFYLEPLRDTEKAAAMVGNKAVTIDIDNPILGLWPLYFLANTPLHIRQYHLWTEGILSSSSVNGKNNSSYLLTDHPTTEFQRKLLWSNGYYFLYIIR